jgi:hypothetical protein
MATKTAHHFPLGNGTVHSFFNARGREQSAPRREVDSSKLLEVRDPGFKKIGVLFLEQVRLTHASGPECPEQWKRQAPIPITHQVPALALSGLDPIFILAWAKDHRWMQIENVGKGSGHGGACHWRFLLRGGLDAVTPRASVGSHKIVSRGVVLRGPEAGLSEMVLGRELAGSRQGMEAHGKKENKRAAAQILPEHFIPLFQEQRRDRS